MSDKLEAAKDAIGASLQELRDSLVARGQGDVDGYLEQMSTDLAIAVAEGDEAGIDEIRAQARAIGGSYQVEANAAGWKLFGAGLKIAAGLLT